MFLAKGSCGMWRLCEGRASNAQDLFDDDVTCRVTGRAYGDRPIAGVLVVDGAILGGFMWLRQPLVIAAGMAAVERAIVYGSGTALGAMALLLLGGSRALIRDPKSALRN